MPSAASVACIVPVRSPAPWLGEALESVLSGDPAPGEVIVVDDASEEPLALPGAAAGHCRLVRLARRGGPAAARDRALAETGAALIALCDADDVWMPGRLAAGLEALASHPGAAVCFGRAEILTGDGRAAGERWAEPPAGALEPGGWATALYESNPVPASSALIRRAALDAAGGFAGPAPLASDWDLWLRLAARGETFVCEPGARIGYRRHRLGVTSDIAALAESQLAVHERHSALVDDATRARVLAADLTALARGRVRRRDYAGARAALREAAQLAPPGSRDRVLSVALAVPGARALLGRRAPYAR